MGKALSIKDEATYELVAELATKTGVTMTQAVNDAVSDKLKEIAAGRVSEAAVWLDKIKSYGVSNEFMAHRWQPRLEEPQS